MNDYDEGNEVFIYYGSRPNSMLLLYSGFRYEGNTNDSVACYRPLFVYLIHFLLSTKILTKNQKKDQRRRCPRHSQKTLSYQTSHSQVRFYVRFCISKN